MQKINITWFGQACFLIKTEDLSIVTDPYDQKIGLTLPKDFYADIVTVSHSHADHSNVSAVGGNPLVISEAGSVKAKSIEVIGIDSFHDEKGGKERGKNVIFKFTLAGVTFAHLGDLGHLLDEKQIKELQNVDVLLIPVGGIYTIDSAAAVKVVDQIKPKIVIPMHYGINGLVFPLDKVGLFTEKLGLPIKKQGTLEVTKDSLPQKLEVVVLEAI